MGDSGHSERNNANERPEQAQRESPLPPSSSSDYTHIYPVRSLLSDVQPAAEDPSNPPPAFKNDFNFLSEALEGDRNAQLRRTAQWQADISSPSMPEQPHSSQHARHRDRSLPLELRASGYSSVVFDSRATHQAPRTTQYTPAANDTTHLASMPGSEGPSPRSTSFADSPPAESDLPPPASIASSQGKRVLSDPGSSSSSLSGYVHLGPVRPEDQWSERSSRSSKSTTALSRSRRRTAIPSAPDHASHDPSPELDIMSVDMGALSISGSNGSGSPSREELSTGGSDGGSSEQFYKTSRLEAAELPDGHHILIGRQGKLERCEDEPIRTPGAVQGFGVLVAIQEDLASGNLIVRQVSENCTEILGLTPQFLFSLECFTHTLPDIQADILWDNIQYLNDPEPDSPFEGNAEESPQVFLLSGYGQPGSIVLESSEGSGSEYGSGSGSGSGHGLFGSSSSKSGSSTTSSSMDRRQWTCWCAAHRPKRSIPPPTSAGQFVTQEDGQPPEEPPSLIILEFELERDIYNPLYPPPDLSSGDLSPATGSDGSDGRNSSGSGNNSVGSDRTTTPGGLGSGPSSTSISTIHSDDTKVAPTVLQTEIPPRNPGLSGDGEWTPSPEDILESTTNRARPIRALERMRRMERMAANRLSQQNRSKQSLKQSSRDRAQARREFGSTGAGTLDVFAVLAQVNEQFSAAPDLQTFLNVVVGIMKDLTQFHRVLVYQFDEVANGQVVAELVDWNQSHDLYRGLHFPAGDIPVQARELYKINKVRSLYDRSQTTARLVGRTKADVEAPLDLTHSYLRAMSPFHIKYLANMGVRGTMSISIVSFGELWGLVVCHSYGELGMRVSFPVRQMLRLLSDSISHNVERLSYAQRLHTRKLISTIPTDLHPTGYIVSNAEDLLGLFDADFGVLVIGEGAKILGPNENGQDTLIVAEYLRLKQFKLMQVTQEITKDFPDIDLPNGLNAVAGLLYVPLSSGGRDFIAFLRKGQLRDISWAGRPRKNPSDGPSLLEPRSSFKAWSETIAGRCRVWTDEQLETAGVLALVYGKFIEVWRQKESAMKATQLTNLLLSNASHEVRTPLNHIINYLELALDGHLDNETRSNLSMSHTASKNLLFTINDLLDLTRLESGNETSFNEPFDLTAAIEEAIQVYRSEAFRRDIDFVLDTSDVPKMVVGDSKKIRTVVSNLTANAVKFTQQGTVTIECCLFNEPVGLRDSAQIVIEIIVGDTGIGIEPSKLESIFREFEQVEQATPPGRSSSPGLGLGLAVVARIVEQLGGQLRVDSKPGVGSRFSFLIPFTLPDSAKPSSSHRLLLPASVSSSDGGASQNGQSVDAIENLVEAISSNIHESPDNASPEEVARDPRTDRSSTKGKSRSGEREISEGTIKIEDSNYPIRSVKVDQFDLDSSPSASRAKTWRDSLGEADTPAAPPLTPVIDKPSLLRILVVEDDAVNRNVLRKRLTLDGHSVVDTTNGREAVELIEVDRAFDCILMDIQMPILNGMEASAKIREVEKTKPLPLDAIRPSNDFNGGIPIFAVSASLREVQREYMLSCGMDGWILKPIDWRRLNSLLAGVTDLPRRQRDMYYPGCSWEGGGWMRPASIPEA